MLKFWQAEILGTENMESPRKNLKQYVQSLKKGIISEATDMPNCRKQFFEKKVRPTTNLIYNLFSKQAYLENRAHNERR